MLDCFIDELKGLINLAKVEVVLTEVVVEPQLHGGVLLLFVFLVQAHVFLHLSVHGSQKATKDLSFRRITVDDAP